MLGWGREGRPHRRRLLGGVAEVAAAALVCAGCTEQVTGRGQPAPPPPPTASGATYLALLDLAGAGAVHYQGSLSAPGLIGIGVDVEVTSGGAALGSVSYQGMRAALLGVNHDSYLRAAQAFWTALGQGKDLAGRYANRWVKAPPAMFGADLGTILAPPSLAADLRLGLDQVRGRRLPDLPATTLRGVRAVKVTTTEASYYVTATEPHRLLRLETPTPPRFAPGAGRPAVVPPRPGQRDITDLGLDVTDASPDTADVYQRIRQQARQLGPAVDTAARLVQGAQTFTACGPASCTLQVTYTNASSRAVRAELHADWTGDGKRLGGCDQTAGQLAPRRVGSTSCTITSPGWVEFYFKAASTPGSHPYVARWTVVALAKPPDLRQLDLEAAAAGCAAAATTDGSVPGSCPPVARQGALPNSAEPPGAPTGADLAAGHDAAVRVSYRELVRRFPRAHVYGNVPGYRYRPILPGTASPTGPTGSRGSTAGVEDADAFPDLLVDLGGRVYVYHVVVATRRAGYTPATRDLLHGYVASLRTDLFAPDVPVWYGPAVDPATLPDRQTGRRVRVFSRVGYPGVIFYALP